MEIADRNLPPNSIIFANLTLWTEAYDGKQA